MRERPSHPVKPAVRKTTLAVDVVVLSPQADTLAALLVRTTAVGRERWSLPWDAPRSGEGLEDAAARIAEGALGATPALLEQVGAFADARADREQLPPFEPAVRARRRLLATGHERRPRDLPRVTAPERGQAAVKIDHAAHREIQLGIAALDRGTNVQAEPA
jgi:ADP-ribose pyrophosphatase YjhB (NUDIX family)